MALFSEFSQTGQHNFQYAAQFPRLHHVHVKFVESLGMLGEGLGKGRPPLHGLRQNPHDLFEIYVFFLFAEGAQTPEKGQACADQGGELSGENGQDLGGYLARGTASPHGEAEGKTFSLGFGGGGGLRDVGGELPLLFDGRGRIGRMVGFDGALVGFTLGVDRGVGEEGHRN